MPKKTIITTVTLGVPDPTQDVAEARDVNGTILLPRASGVAHAAPGKPVTLDAGEADAILARFGGEVLEVIPDTVPEKSPAKAPTK